MFHIHVIGHLQQASKVDFGKKAQDKGTIPKGGEVPDDIIASDDIRFWGHNLLMLCESLMKTVLDDTDLVLLSTAPDHVFATITLAAISLLKAQATVLHHFKARMSFGLLVPFDKHVDQLRRISLSSNHAPNKYADVIVTFLDAWESFKAERVPPPPPVEQELAVNVVQEQQIMTTDQMWMTSDFPMPNFTFGMNLGQDVSMMDFSVGSLQPMLDEWFKGSEHGVQGGNSYSPHQHYQH